MRMNSLHLLMPKIDNKLVIECMADDKQPEITESAVHETSGDKYLVGNRPPPIKRRR